MSNSPPQAKKSVFSIQKYDFFLTKYAIGNPQRVPSIPVLRPPKHFLTIFPQKNAEISDPCFVKKNVKKIKSLRDLKKSLKK